MPDIENLVKDILTKGHLMSLATVDENGPWVSDVIFVYDEKYNLYWLSDEVTRHSQAILKNPSVAATITLSNKSKEPNQGLQIAGTAEKIDGDVFVMAIQHRIKRSKPAPEKEGDILDPGESWYKMTPTKIELIYEPLFGFTKQTFL